jgi:hypothetical protein
LDENFAFAIELTVENEETWKSPMHPDDFKESGRPLTHAEFTNSRAYWVDAISI